MTQINDPKNLNGKLFGYEIKYNNPENPGIAPGRFNGNIAEVDWNNGSENLLKRYSYQYDNLNRLTNAFYKEPSTGIASNFDEYLPCDLNGNIMTLKRYASQVYPLIAAKVDDLDYQYTGNRLNKIIENALNDTVHPEIFKKLFPAKMLIPYISYHHMVFIRFGNLLFCDK